MSDTTPPPPPQQPPVPPQQPPMYQQPPQQPPAAGYQPPQYAAAPAAQPLAPESDKSAAMWAHIGGIVGFLPSLLIWLILKDRGPRTNVEAKEALNWQITFTIVYVAVWIVVSILNTVLYASLPWGMWWLTGVIGLLPLVLWVLNVVFSIMGGVRVNAGGSYRYPFNFRFIK